MKKVRNISGLGFASALMFCAVVCLGTAVPAGAQTGEQYCEITLSRCPEQYDKDTLVVPLSVVSLSSKIQACATTTDTDVSEPPAIMFIIDHSTSMNTNGDCQNGGCDPNGSRFQVTRALIDTIYGNFPSAEVGITVFANGLVFDANRDANLVTYDDVYEGVVGRDTVGIPRQSYMPLKPLNAQAVGGGFYTGAGTPTIYQVYRSMFTSGAGRTWGLNGRPSMGGTNISLAFATALKAFESTTIPKKNQYIIFISDGINRLIEERQGADACTGNTWCGRGEEFAAGVNTPTTYTVYLQGSTENPTAPSILTRMTNNVKNNDYSENNKNSDIWAVNDGYDSLLTLMMDNIVSKMLQTKVVPKRIVVTSAGITDSAGNLVDTFSFKRMLPIDTGSVASVRMGLRYDVKKDTVDENGNTVSIDFETMQEYNFWIRRTANEPPNWASSQGLTSKCDVKPGLSLLFEGKPVDVIKGNMTNLTVQFSTGGFFEYDPSEVNIQIRTKEGAVKDTVYTKSLVLDNRGTILLWNFVRASVADEQISTANNRLEHSTSQDSVVLFFRNPRIPLDTIRVAYLYLSHEMAFKVTRADGSVKRVMKNEILEGVPAGETLNIDGLLLTGAGGDEVDDDMVRSGTWTWSLSGADGATITADPSNSAHAQFMATKAPQDYVVTVTYTSGTMTIIEKFTIKVVPGAPEYLEVVFTDPDKTPPPAQVGPDVLVKNKKLEIPKGVRDTVLYVVERDKYGNYIGLATSARWTKEGGGICYTGTCSEAGGSSVGVRREGESFAAGNKVIVKKGGMETVVDVTVVGDALAAIGPNPFIPNVSSPKDIYNRNHPAVYEYYKKILEADAVGGGIGGGGATCKSCGILVAGTAPKGILKEPNGRDPKATVIIYDAVGNVVFKSKPAEITLIEENNTFGFVWNGKNGKGRTVGPGTYLVRMYVELDGDKFVEQRKIGVTKSTK